MAFKRSVSSCFPTYSGVYIVLLSVIFMSMLGSIRALLFTKTEQTYAKFPKWNACPNSSFSFEFKTTQPKALLMYADDSGNYDYIEVMINDAKVRLRMNIVDGRDGVVEISLGTRLNDNRWHHVEIQRNRMESRLFVDGLKGSSLAFGSDFKFGDINRNSHVYFGGIPDSHTDKSLPSSYYEPRFEGEIRNVIYWNCTCIPVLGHMIEGRGVSTSQNETCENSNTCPQKCLCIDRDEGPGCQCNGLRCPSDADTFYHLPMDAISGEKLDNPSGLDAKVTGNPETVKGVLGNALKIDCQTSKIKVSGPGHRQECFGDLDLCPKGYTIGVWVKFDKPEPGNAVYLSNGGQTTESHGVAMSYQVGQLQWVFRTKNGQEWRVSANNILPRHWYHVIVTWSPSKGLTLFINGNKISSDEVASFRKSTANVNEIKYDDFIIGQSNDGKGISDLGIMTIDDFRFWSYLMTETKLREMGPIYKYYLSMDQLEIGKLVVPNLEPKTLGYLRQTPGKFGNAVYFPGSGEYIDFGPFYETCIGNASRCMYGFMASFWIKFYQVGNATYMYYLTSGVRGFSVYSYADRIYTSAQMGDSYWEAFAAGMENGRWYFIEISWTRADGLSLYVDLQLKMTKYASTHNEVKLTNRHDHFYIGRDNNFRYTGRSAFAIDDLEIFNANRERLLEVGFIQRGKAFKTYYSFDTMIGTTIQEATTTIQTYGRPELVPGKIGQALMLTGNIQVAQFDHGDGCLGNLDYCVHGVMLSLWFRPEEFKEGMFYLSSGINGITFSYFDRKFRVSAMTTPLKWEVTTSYLEKGQWYFLETSWGPNSGLMLYANGRLVAEDKYSEENIEAPDTTKLLYDKFVFGKENTDKTGSVYGAALFDEMEFWYGTRDYLLAFDYIQRGMPTHFRIKMDDIMPDGRSIAHASLPVRLNGRPSLVPGVMNKAVKLSGNEQYINLGASKNTCLGNIELCHFGIYISMWTKIDEYDYNMYLMSTGRNGIRIYYVAGYIYVTVNNADQSWRLSIPRMTLNVWHLLELSWHPEFGLEVLIDGERTMEKDSRQIPTLGSRTGEFYIGGPNIGDTSGQRFTYARMSVDDLQVWYGRREELLAFDYIVGDTIEHETFSMETASGDVIHHPRYRLTLERGAKLVPGKVGNAVSFSGTGQYVDLGKHMDKCLGNLDLCNHGITLSMLLKPRRLREKSYFLSSPTYSLYYEDRQLKSRFTSGGKQWTVSSKHFRENEWNSVMLSWEPSDGLQILVNDTLVDNDVTPSDVMQGDQSKDEELYLGKSGDPNAEAVADFQMDEVQIWYANLEKLRSRGLLKGPVHETIPFYQIGKDGVLKLPSRTITVYGGVTMVKGQHRNALELDGKKQYIDLGDNLTCSGNLDNCPYGFTMRFSTKPRKLVNNMYFLDSYPIKIFYRDGKLYTTVKTSSKSWTVAAPGFKAGEWQVVDVSWHPEVGLTLHVNEEESGAQKTYGTEQIPVYNYDRKTYFGRALTKMIDERYAATALENFEVWNVRRDVLIADDKLLEQETDSIPLPPVPRTPVPTLPPPAKQSTDQTVSNDDGTVRRVLVTGLPGGSTQLLSSSITNGQFSGTSKIIRFFGESRVGYQLSVLPQEMMVPGNNESISFLFITEVKDGLIWMFRGSDGTKMHISLKDGYMLFVYDNGRTRPEQVEIPLPGGRLNDFRWHTFTVQKEPGNRLKFFIDKQLRKEYQMRSDIQFVDAGFVDLGGTSDVAQATRNLVTTNFDGAITDVEIRKYTGDSKEYIVRFLQFVDKADRSGFLQVWNYDDFIKGIYSWRPEPPTTTQPPPPRDIKSPVTFTTGNAVFYLRDALDFRGGGSVKFRFRTLDHRGLLAIAKGTAISNDFFALEIFDGILYFVYNFGGYYGRKQFSIDDRVDDGLWHDVSIVVAGDRITTTLDSKQIPVALSRSQVNILFFYRLYIGGFDEFENIPWSIYSRSGYKGCVESLRVNDIPVDLHSRFNMKNVDIQGVIIGCKTETRSCLDQPCLSGFCRDHMGGYVCDCASTAYTGQNCEQDAVIASWDGTKSTIYRLLIPKDTHTNDISFRFLTPLSNTLLFSTESRNKQDYIRAEVVNGRVVVTFRADGKTKTFETNNVVNDNSWHVLNIRRRADDVEVWVDEAAHLVGMIGGNNYIINVDQIKFGSLGQTGSLESNSYIGYMQNFIFGDRELLGELKKQPNSNVIWITNVNWEDVPLITYKPITVSTSEAHFQLPSLKPGLSMNLMFKFKTREKNGLMLYNAGPGSDVIAIELTNGALRLAYNLGVKDLFTMGPGQLSLNDNMWHTVQVSFNKEGQLTLKVDGDKTVVSNIEGDKRLNLFEKLYIGGLPQAMFDRPGIRNLIESRQGFRGCLASMDLNGAVPELMKYAMDKEQIFNGCSELGIACKPDACGQGICMPGLDSFWCNCNMTGYMGDFCEQYPVGYYFGRNGKDGVLVYEYPYTANSDLDQIAFGFMTKQENAVLYRIEGNVGNEFIEIRMENGYIVAESNTGGGIRVMKYMNRPFNDGQYHVLRYIRTGRNSTLQVDQFATQTAYHSGVSSLFDKVYRVILGGRVNAQGVQSNNYNGIMGGAYYNGYRWMDAYKEGVLIGGQSVEKFGDVVLSKPFILYNTVQPTPPSIIIPPNVDVPSDIGGGGSTIGGTLGGGDPIIGIGGPGGDITSFPGGTGINVPGETVPLASALTGPAPPPMATGARAGAVVGTVLGTMAFMSSLMWALYKLKPGVPACLSPGAGSAGAGAGGGGMSISSPRTTSNLGAVQAASAGGGGGAAGSGGSAGAGGGGGALASKVTVVNGSASGGGAGGSTTYTSYFQSTNTSIGGGGGNAAISGGHGSAGHSGGVDQFDSATLRATGTFSNKGTAIGSPRLARANLGSSSSAYSSNYQSNTMQSYGSDMGGGGGAGTYDRHQFASSSSAGQDIPDYDMPVSGTLQSGQSYSSSTLNTHYNYQVSGTNLISGGGLHTNTRSLTLNHPNHQTQTSVLNLIISRSNAITPVRHELYTLALRSGSSSGHVFVERSEDLLIEERPEILVVNTGQKATDIGKFAEVNLRTDVGSASYHVDGYVNEEFNTGANPASHHTGGQVDTGYITLHEVSSQRNIGVEMTTNIQTTSKCKSSAFSFPKFDIFSKNRKASLQVNNSSTEFEINQGGYEKMGMYVSEGNIAETSLNTLPSSSRKPNRVAKQQVVDLSHDNLYESTATITSSVRSESMDTNLESIEDVSERNDVMKLDLLMASLEDFNINMSEQQSTDVTSSQTGAHDIYAKVDKSKQKQVTNQGHDSNKQSSGFKVTCTAELKRESTSSKSSSSSSSSSSRSSSSPVHNETSISFDDTLKQFQNFVVGIDDVSGTGPRTGFDVSLEDGSQSGIRKPGPSTSFDVSLKDGTKPGMRTDFDDRQIERGEQVMQEDKPTFTRAQKSQESLATSSISREILLMTNTSDVNMREVSSQSTTRSSGYRDGRDIGTNRNLSGKLDLNMASVVIDDPSSHKERNFDDELNQSVHALLTGINVDTSGWTAIKDATSVEDQFEYEVQNVKTVGMNRQGHYVLTTGGFSSSGAVTPGAAADEVRVDCCLITNDGRYVVTGSSLGPPQVWDMQTGELQTIMKGDTIGSTDLHLVCKDSLLVGAVHCDMEINEYSGRKGVFNHTLQIWDFSSGKPLTLGEREGEYCSVICPMTDSDKILFGRTDKYGDATSIIAWDLMGNQMIKEMRYEGPVGNNDYINFLKLSKNDRYVVAGFTNSFDNCAEFMVFDMSMTSYNVNEQAMLKLDANPDCTVILPKDEAVTGLRNGDLVIWSIRTGQPSRQLLGSGGAHAHSREVKAVSLSEDGRYLVSASADGTLKVWDMHTERPIHTLAGHADEVWCCGISIDNEIIVSGSNDGTIRLWRMKNGTEMCVFNCGVDIFSIIMSRDKGTIVALGDKYGARKLIMLQVVRTKIKKIVSS